MNAKDKAKKNKSTPGKTVIKDLQVRKANKVQGGGGTYGPEN
jgi:hypothetical protein